jgi:hypothetical protein
MFTLFSADGLSFLCNNLHNQDCTKPSVAFLAFDLSQSI